MILYPYITAHYPTWDWYCREIPTMTTAPAWYHYLLAGLREVCTVEIDPAQDALSASREGEQWTAVRFEWTGGTHTAIYDWCDFDRVHDHLECDSYYKIMCRADSGVRAIGQTLASMDTLDLLPKLRLLTLQPPKYDVICLGRATNWQMRVDAVRRLRAKTEWRQLTGVSPYPRRDPVPEDVIGERLTRPQYLAALAQSRVCVALPGVGGDWTWRHTEALACGVALVCPDGPYLLPGDYAGAMAICSRDLSNLVDVVGELLADDEKRQALAQAGRAYFDAHLTPRAMARRLVKGL